MARSRGVIGAVIALLAIPLFLHAQTAEQLQAQIDEHQSKIEALNAEIAQYEKDLAAVGAKKQTLQTAVNAIDLSVKKTQAKISAIQNQIASTELEIQQLNGDIGNKEASISVDAAALAETVRSLYEFDRHSLVEAILAHGSMADIWNDAETTQTVQQSMEDQVRLLQSTKQALTEDRDETEDKRQELIEQKSDLASQKESLSIQQREQQRLLTQTKNQESNYQAILAQKRAQEASFEEALTDLQTQLQYVIDPSKITPAGKGVLQWPLSNVRITQHFGNTEFALSGAYNGKGHNGIDLAASIGTPVKAALGGVVIGTGNTDAVKGCYSFGKWVMVKHANGLNTMYAHFSQINVSEGQQVSTGQVLGYSGQTGYATGPHLHFGVYVSSATQIIPLGEATKSRTPCATAVMPVVPLSGYLNPLDYL